jgi:hypothetical protein
MRKIRNARHERVAGWLVLVVAVPTLLWTLGVALPSVVGERDWRGLPAIALYVLVIVIATRNGWRHTRR